MASVQQIIDDLWAFSDAALSERRFREALTKHRSATGKLELRTQIARAMGLQRRFDEALAALDEVDRELATQNAKAEVGNARLRTILERGRALNSSGNRMQALPLFEQAFDLAQSIGNDNLAIDAAHMIAIVHGAESRNDEAMRWNLNALEAAESSTQPRARQWRGSLHNNIGWTLHDQGRFTDALQHFERALECRIEEGKPAEIRIAKWCIARTLRSLGKIDQALAAQEALLDELAQNSQADGFVHEEIGECLMALDRSGDAAAHFARAHELLSHDEFFALSHEHRLARLAELARVTG